VAPRAAFLIATTVASSLSETNLQSPTSNLPPDTPHRGIQIIVFLPSKMMFLTETGLPV
jgi:hypothetical protein